MAYGKCAFCAKAALSYFGDEPVCLFHLGERLVDFSSALAQIQPDGFQFPFEDPPASSSLEAPSGPKE